jgi:tetratricopeptide (TPR) repeat protein
MAELSLQQAFLTALQFQQNRQFPQAEAAYRQILASHPDHPDALHLLGLLAVDCKRDDIAVDLIQRARARAPGNAFYHQSLGGIYLRLRRYNEALPCFQQVIALKPQHAEAHCGLGICLQETGRLDEAIACHRRALEIQPNFAAAYSNLAGALSGKGMWDESAAACHQALALDPRELNACRVLALGSQSRIRFEDAIHWYRRALELGPNDPDMHSSLGTALQQVGQFDEALACYRRALAINPNHGSAHFNLSLLLLLLGDYGQGWREYEWRWHCREYQAFKQTFRQPAWDGSDLAGRTLLVHTEQGFGDAIQFIRYAPMIVQRGGTVIIGCREPGLMRLLSQAPGVSQCFGPGQPLPRFDFHCALMSLAHLLGTTLETIPPGRGYLTANAEEASRWSQKISAAPARLKVGLVWASGQAIHGKSVALSALAPLAAVAGVRFFSLQKGPAASEAKNPPPGMEIVDWTDELGDFADTAALVANLDLVISVDTAVTHLAGALGKPVWTLLRRVPDWSWLLDRPDSLWYPTMRLFRQPTRGDWTSVIARVGEALKERVHGASR